MSDKSQGACNVTGGFNVIAIEGEIKNNSIVINNDISAYNGNAVIVTILDRPYSRRRDKVNLDSYSHKTERGQHVDDYMHEMRDNDRI